MVELYKYLIPQGFLIWALQQQSHKNRMRLASPLFRFLKEYYPEPADHYFPPHTTSECKVPGIFVEYSPRPLGEYYWKANKCISVQEQIMHTWYYYRLLILLHGILVVPRGSIFERAWSKGTDASPPFCAPQPDRWWWWWWWCRALLLNCSHEICNSPGKTMVIYSASFSSPINI